MLREEHRTRKLEVGIGEPFHVRPGSALDCAMSFSEKAPIKSLTSNLPWNNVSGSKERGQYTRVPETSEVSEHPPSGHLGWLTSPSRSCGRSQRSRYCNRGSYGSPVRRVQLMLSCPNCANLLVISAQTGYNKWACNTCAYEFPIAKQVLHLSFFFSAARSSLIAHQ